MLDQSELAEWPKCPCGSGFAAKYYCKDASCPCYENCFQYGDCCMVEEKHDHAGRLVSKLCEQLQGAETDVVAYLKYVFDECQDRAEPLRELIEYFKYVSAVINHELPNSVDTELSYVGQIYQES